MRRLSVLVVLLSMLVAAMASPVAAALPVKASAKSDVYLVILAASPVVTYGGGIAGLPATVPARGKKVNPTSLTVKQYVAYLDKTHADLVAKVGGPSTAKFYDYRYSLNGFAATLTAAQAAKLRATKGVMAVELDVLHRPTTDNSPQFLHLNDTGTGLWSQGIKGEDVIVGVVDTGIWPEHPSFSDQSDLADRSGDSAKRLRVYGPPPAYWHGRCQAGEQWSTDDCNNKLIGARYFLAGFGHHGIAPKGDYKSARDHDGHGTHTSSTAAGNAGVSARIFGRPFGIVSGIAPRARVAMYKALWNDVGGFTSDLAAAIDAAVADGVDVINYSIGSSVPSYTGADDLSFLFAARNGVYVASSAGNDGPGAETIGSPSADPWLTTVGASTQNRTFQATATLGNGTTVTGASVTEAIGTRPLVDSANLTATGADPADAALCMAGSLDPAKTAGNIVLCLRGGNARVDKSKVVRDAGGVGMILYNPDNVMALVTDNHWVPSVHINFTDGTAVKNYIAAPGPSTASISAGTKVPAQGSVMADFSSRGPNTAALDIIKPDVTAPGVNILAGNTPTPFSSRPGQLFQSISGTSMSSPHVAGIGALLVQAHRDWTPGMIKSALMTTGRQDVVKEDTTTAADPFDFGAGHVVPNSAANPGLVYPTTYDDYIAFLCGATTGLVSQAACDARAALGLSFDASDLNIASIGIAGLVGSQTVTRKVMSVASGSTTWHATATVPGYNVTVPANFTLAPAATKSFGVTFQRTTAPLDEWVFGEFVLSDGTHQVRSPVALRAQSVVAPDLVSEDATAASGSFSWEVTSGYDGIMTAAGNDLVADNVTAGLVVAQDPDQDPQTQTLTSGMYVKDFTLTGAQYLAGGTRAATTEAGSDLDVYLLYEMKDGQPGFTFDDLVAQSADADSEEIVQLVHPADGKYKLLVHGWGTPDGASSFSLHEWVVDDAAPDVGTFEAHVGASDSPPTTVSAGEVVTVTGTYSGLATTGTQYRGVVDYSDGTNVLGFSTVVEVNR
jgi:subtilisin family serine protease